MKQAKLLSFQWSDKIYLIWKEANSQSAFIWKLSLIISSQAVPTEGTKNGKALSRRRRQLSVLGEYTLVLQNFKLDKFALFAGIPLLAL